MKNFFDEVLSELEHRIGKKVTLETVQEREILKEILSGFEAGALGKRAKQLQRRAVKKPKKVKTESIEATPVETNDYYSDRKLFLHSDDALQLIEKGYRKGAHYNAPGNAGSAFNETLSNEGVILLGHFALTLHELALAIYYRTLNTELGNQQKDMPRNGVTIPPEIPRIGQDLYLASYLAAKSACMKHDRAVYGTRMLNLKIGFQLDRRLAFGGSMGDLRELTEKIIEADKCYVYDSELNDVVLIPRLELMKWAQSAGGAVNSGDTAIVSIDVDGNILYDGWSDKKSTADIQSNSTLNDDFNRIHKKIVDFYEIGILKQEFLLDSLNIVKSYQTKIGKIEDSYSNAAIGEANYFKSLNSFGKELVAIWMDIQETFYKKNNTSNHVDNSKIADGFSGATNYAYVDYLMKHGPSKSAVRCKVINRIAIMERAWLKYQKKQIPIELDTLGIVSLDRERVMKLHSQSFTDLNQYHITYNDCQIPLGNVLLFHDTIDMLQISKIEKPKSKTDYKQYLKRNTNLIMGGIQISPDLIKSTLGITDMESYITDYSFECDERILYDNGNKYVTGKVVHLYSRCSNGNKTEIGYKTYRSKQGFSGKTSNTIQWSAQIQSNWNGCLLK